MVKQYQSHFASIQTGSCSQARNCNSGSHIFLIAAVGYRCWIWGSLAVTGGAHSEQVSMIHSGVSERAGAPHILRKENEKLSWIICEEISRTPSARHYVCIRF